MILSRRTIGDIEISDVGNIEPQGLKRINCNVIIGNHSSTNDFTNNIDINSNVFTDGTPIQFNANVL